MNEKESIRVLKVVQDIYEEVLYSKSYILYNADKNSKQYKYALDYLKSEDKVKNGIKSIIKEVNENRYNFISSFKEKNIDCDVSGVDESYIDRVVDFYVHCNLKSDLDEILLDLA